MGEARDRAGRGGTSNASDSVETTGTAYFTFEVDGRPVGYFQERDADGVLFARADIVLDGEHHENPFWLRYRGERVLAFRRGDGPWVDFDQPADVYPSAALPLLVRAVAPAARFTYRQFDEGSQRIVGTAVLTREGDTVLETLDGEARRSVRLRDGAVVEYGWGGTAVSRRVASRAEAVRGTAFDQSP